MFRAPSPRSGRLPWRLGFLLVLLMYFAVRHYSGVLQHTWTRHQRQQRRTQRPRPAPPAVEGQNVVAADRVRYVVDGDTVVLEQAGTVRLIGIDCPETGQPGGHEATDWCRSMLGGKNVLLERCAKRGHDRYGRVLGFLYLTGEGGERVLFNREVVRNGYARVYSLRPCTVDEAAWQEDYEAARRERRGLFGTLGEVPDAAWRRERRVAAATSGATGMQLDIGGVVEFWPRKYLMNSRPAATSGACAL